MAHMGHLISNGHVLHDDVQLEKAVEKSEEAGKVDEIPKLICLAAAHSFNFFNRFCRRSGKFGSNKFRIKSIIESNGFH